MKQVHFEQVGRHCFDPAKAFKFPQYQVELWPGFDVRLKKGGNNSAAFYLNIEPCHKVIRH